MKVIYQVWQIWSDTGDEFLLGTYFTNDRARKEVKLLEKQEGLPVQYIIRKWGRINCL